MNRLKSLLPLCVLLAATALTMGCQQKKQDFNFTITGTAFDDTRSVYLLMDGTTLCKARVKDGSFVMQGRIDTVCLAFFRDENYIGLPVVLEPGAALTIDEPRNLVGGSPLNDRLYLYVKPWTDWYIETCHVCDSLDRIDVPTADRAALPELRRINSLQQRLMDTVAWQVYRDNLDNLVGAYLFGELLGWAEQNDDLFNETEHPVFDRLLAEYAQASPAVRDDEDIEYMIERLQTQLSVGPGNHFRDFPALIYPDRRPTTLGAEIQGRVAVIDFWASWCGPCKLEISEELIPLYNKYADRGLVVLGVDVDDHFSRHERATKELGIPYRQIIDTSQTSKQLYGVNMIPQVFLIAADGTMLGNFHRGDGKLESAVKNALGIDE